jgi:hypothetical protein
MDGRVRCNTNRSSRTQHMVVRRDVLAISYRRGEWMDLDFWMECVLVSDGRDLRLTLCVK